MRGEKEIECDNTSVLFRVPKQKAPVLGYTTQMGRKSSCTVYQGSVPPRDKNV